MDLRARRSILSAQENPDQKLDYVVSLKATIKTSLAESPVEACLRYVPDRVVLKPASLDDYLGQVGAIRWSSPEEFAVTVLNDINDELVARWIEVSLKIRSGDIDHDVVLEEQQPQWEKQDILFRLPTS